jgi:hypothetical protein
MMNNQYYYPYNGDIPQQKTLHVLDILAIVLLSLLASSIGLLCQYNIHKQGEQQTSMVSYAQQFMKENGISSMKDTSCTIMDDSIGGCTTWSNLVYDAHENRSGTDMKNVSYVRSNGTAFNGILVRNGSNVTIQ